MPIKTFSIRNRTHALESFQTELFDLVVIGGGINGAGIARDATSRGMRVALVEARDFASGTSSRSSKLVHGGIRYLENFEFHLVFEALTERARLFEMAPHLVHPLRFMIPLYQGGRVGMTKMGLGMWVYDALSMFEAPELHERLTAKESCERQPLIQSENLLGSYVYSDAYMDDDRLVFETLRSCASEQLAAASYVKALGVHQIFPEGVWVLECEDLVANKKIMIRSRHVVSTVGPWTDEFGRALYSKEWKPVLRPTKGVHLTFEKQRLPLSSAVVMAAESRIVFGIPRHEMVIVGTTDTDFKGDPEKVATEAGDVRYLLRVINQYFPQANIAEKDIVASYAGVRPLVQDGSDLEGKTSREHEIWTDDRGVTFVAGGKYTTYRLIAQQAVDHCLAKFSIPDRVRYLRGSTMGPLNPLVTSEAMSHKIEMVQEVKEKTGWVGSEADWLVDRHGPEALFMLERYGKTLSYWEIEAEHAIDQTMCFHLLDFFTRRVPLVLARVDHGVEFLDLIARVFACRLNWSSSETQSEKQKFQLYLEREFAWKKEL